MKYLLNGVAIAAALAIASPVWAQAPTPAQPAPMSPGAHMQTNAKPMARHKHMRPKRMARHHRHHHRHGHMNMSAGDQETEALNRQELQRLQGGGGPEPMGAAGPAPMGAAGPGPAPMGGPPPAGSPPPNAGAGQGGPRASGH
jgi:hypothetical protein